MVVHEVSLVAALVDAAVVRAAGRPVTLVRVRHATTIPRDVLCQAFELLIPGGPLDGVTLEGEPFDVLIACACGHAGALVHDDLVGGGMAACPACGALLETPRTAELELLEVRTAT